MSALEPTPVANPRIWALPPGASSGPAIDAPAHEASNKGMKRILAALLLLTLAAPAWGQDFEKGLEAYEQRDYAAALREWRPLAEQGHAEAQFKLGVMYVYGWGVPEDYAEAVKWWRKAAEQGHAYAQTSVGSAYEKGRSVPQDYAEAMKWHRLAAEQGNVTAQTSLAILYFRGEGVPQHYAEAVKWFRKAAEQGGLIAQINLGVMYSKGQGVPQDYIMAHIWLNLAVSRLTHDTIREIRDIGVKHRDIVAENMTTAEIAEAQRLAREWMAAFEKRKKK